MSNFVVCVTLATLVTLFSVTRVDAVLPQEIPVAAVFDEEGDPKLQLAFVHGIDRINQVSNVIQLFTAVSYDFS